jgi:hypothetical protein
MQIQPEESGAEATAYFPKVGEIDRYLEPSPILADGGAQVGKFLRDLGHPESPIKAIRAKCLDCSGGNDAEVRKCVATGCTLWPFRMGVNPFHGRAQS